MNAYKQLKDRQQKEFDAFPLGAAFSKKQFAEMMQKWDLTENDTDKILSIGFNCFIRKSDRERFHEMNARHKKEKQDAITADKTGDGFICAMFYYELGNHEYCITYDLEDTFDALDLTEEQVNADERLIHGLEKALKKYLKNCNG